VVEGYTREDVEAALQKICPFDWHGFFEARVYQVNGKPPTEGFEAAGWRLIYNDKPEPEFFWAATPGGVGYIGTYSIGMDLKKDGTIADVMPDTPAYEAGLGPQMKVIAVEGRAYSNEVLDAAVAHPRDGKISLTVRNFETVKSFKLKYAGGVRYPHLERIPGTHDYLSEILTEKSYK
jgi:predicted metalloprotease with PDZ domain